jgi:pimeloyl-ACP methyl ester carboxylesterase
MSTSKPLRKTWIELFAAAATLVSLWIPTFGQCAASGAHAMTSTDYRSAVGAQEPRKTIMLDGVSISYSDTGGTGPVLICLHAIGHGARDFQDLGRRLGPRFRVIAIDFPGQGNSGPDSQPASGSRYTQLVSEFINKLDLHSVILLGNSIGGAVSVRYASTHPENVRALVLCDSGGLGPPPDEGSKVYIKKFVTLFGSGVRGDPEFASAFEQYYRTVLIEEPARAERDRIVRAAYEVAPVLVQAWQSFARPEESLQSLLPQIQTPVLLAWARDDAIITLRSGAIAYTQFPNARLEVFAGGHAAFLEDPDRFEKELRRFIGTLELG